MGNVNFSRYITVRETKESHRGRNTGRLMVTAPLLLPGEGRNFISSTGYRRKISGGKDHSYCYPIKGKQFNMWV